MVRNRVFLVLESKRQETELNLVEINCENLLCFESLSLLGGTNVTGSPELPRSRV